MITELITSAYLLLATQELADCNICTKKIEIQEMEGLMGMYSIPDRTIYLNPKVTRRTERLWVINHEMGHDIFRDLKSDVLRKPPFITEYAKTDYHESIAEEWADWKVYGGRPNKKQKILIKYYDVKNSCN